MGDRDERSQLQRRGGRRISLPSSPISPPSFFKRNERPVRSPDGVHPGEGLSATDTSSNRPSIDLNFPSPTFESSMFTTSPATDVGHKTNGDNTYWADPSESKSPELLDMDNRTQLASRVSDGRQSLSSRPPYMSDMSSRSSPSVVGMRSKADAMKNFDHRERHLDLPSSAGRNYSTTSLSTDRSASDENVPNKVPTMKKSRLNLLNPMSLLARRRSSQNTKLEDMNVNVSPLHVPAIPENFEPSIRGNIVHDFSRPRNRKGHYDNSPRRDTFSSPGHNRGTSDITSPSTQYNGSPSQTSHSPMFKEHFQEDEHALRPGQTAYLHSATSSRKMFEAPVPATLPSFAQKLPAILPEPEKSKADSNPVHDIPHPDAPPPPPPPPKRTPSPNLDLPPAAALPRHMTSVSSRFSFQIADQGSSNQEKLLEEKHKEQFGHEPEYKHDAENGEDDFDHYDFDAEDDIEEGIPGLNTDFYEDDGFDVDDVPIRNIEIQSSSQQLDLAKESLQGFHFTPASSTFSPTVTHQTSEPTPRDDQGFAIGVADTKNSPMLPRSSDFTEGLGSDPATHVFDGLRISTINEPSYESGRDALPTQAAFDDSELYFDDGEFDLDDVPIECGFDEDMLDDESGLIRDIPAENLRRYEAALERGAPDDKIAVVDPQDPIMSRDTSSSSKFVNVRDMDDDDELLLRQFDETNHTQSSKTSILTEDNLAAYHDALVEATNTAVASGKFNRQVSFNSDHSGSAEGLHAPIAAMPTPGRDYHANGFNTESDIADDFNGLAFDEDYMDDDLMIAEANAEALENDDDGFYGQEFGFYARAHGKDGSDYTNGGYFATRGSNGVKRSYSGKANFQEPCLTPITERSEWSTRNSVASLQMHAGFPSSAQAIPSPGLSQLLDSPSFEDDMTLSALMKLRRGAFGGSSTSVNSMGERSMPGSSPLANVSSYAFPPMSSHATKQSLGNSASVVESEEEADAEMEQHTLTQNTPRKKTPGPSPTTPQSQTVHLAVTDSAHGGKKGHHRRNSSGADSVSYIRDSDGRWVLERRRTGDDGEQEIIEREYLAGARI